MPDDISYASGLSGVTTLPCSFMVMGAANREVPVVMIDGNDPKDKATVEAFMRRVLMDKTFSVILIRPENIDAKPEPRVRTFIPRDIAAIEGALLGGGTVPDGGLPPLIDDLKDGVIGNG